jgi:hypothetical protein
VVIRRPLLPGGDTLPYTIADYRRVELGEHTEQLCQCSTVRVGVVGGQVQPFRHDMHTSASSMQLVDRPIQVADRPGESRHLMHDHVVELACTVEHGTEPLPVGVGAGRSIDVLDELALGQLTLGILVQCVHLAVDRLLGRRYPGIQGSGRAGHSSDRDSTRSLSSLLCTNSHRSDAPSSCMPSPIAAGTVTWYCPLLFFDTRVTFAGIHVALTLARYVIRGVAEVCGQ